MKRFTNTVAILAVAMTVFTSCQENASEDLVGTALATTQDLTSDEISSAIETMAINYSITVIGEDDGTLEISNDDELAEYGKKHAKPRIEFPIEITVDGEVITVNSKEELKALIGNKKKNHRTPPFELVFPVSVTTEDGTQEIADKEAFKAYRESLEKGTHPAFVFPISVIIDEETIVVNSEEELKELMPANDRPARPEFVFPVSVTTETGTEEIADQEAFKTYVQSLEEGTHPAFVFPISVVIDEETIAVNSEEELKTLMPKKGDKGGREGGQKPGQGGEGQAGARPEFVFPLSVTTEAGTEEIADQEAFKTYVQSLEEGTHPTFVFPISVVIDEETTVVNSEEELKALMPKKGGKGDKGGRR
ncbi:hypothetical protein [Flavicella sediminum]|uniref:hypothetical protein n=1 Tax=Flavicella sediminum TaxID=2585141 RepID=UPI001124BCDB|nr:hypothetical protein [Flavicella sediminum]